MTIKFNTTNELIEYYGGSRTVAYQLDYDSSHIYKISTGRLPLNRRMAFKFLEQYKDLSLEDIKTLIK